MDTYDPTRTLSRHEITALKAEAAKRAMALRDEAFKAAWLALRFAWRRTWRAASAAAMKAMRDGRRSSRDRADRSAPIR